MIAVTVGCVLRRLFKLWIFSRHHQTFSNYFHYFPVVPNGFPPYFHTYDCETDICVVLKSLKSDLVNPAETLTKCKCKGPRSDVIIQIVYPNKDRMLIPGVNSMKMVFMSDP